MDAIHQVAVFHNRWTIRAEMAEEETARPW